MPTVYRGHAAPRRPVAEIYWVDAPGPGRVAVVSRPRGGGWLDDDMAAFAAEGIDLLVSTLVDEEMRDTSIAREAEAAAAAGIEFRRLPIANMGLPERASADAFIQRLAGDVRAGRTFGVHCYASVGRSPMIAASVLVVLGVVPAEAWRRIEAARGREVPDTTAQRRWVERFLPVGAGHRDVRSQ